MMIREPRLMPDQMRERLNAMLDLDEAARSVADDPSEPPR
jgi:hypothetical protein